MRVILDTNILLSAILSPLGVPAKLLDAWERKWFTLVACHELIAELRDELVTGDERRSEEHTSELQSHLNIVCRLLLEKKKNKSSYHMLPRMTIELKSCII